MLRSVNKDIVIFSHLRWEFVTQRPQHIAKRLAKDKKVLFIEEPIPFNGDFGTAKIIKPDENITVLQPKIYLDNYREELIPIVKNYLEKLSIDNPILWFYSPAFVEVANKIERSLIVYDCMDELSAFKEAPQSLIDQEKELLEIADVVFTGGKSLYESKKIHNKNTFCFPSSVDREHFEKASTKTDLMPDELVGMGRPIIGYYGVIDERIDLDLLDEVSSLVPNASFVMIGPVVKIEEKNLPRKKNLFYLGIKDYKDLPKYLSFFNIAMMPFAINQATKFISPTKTLEFMAAKKPIISTPIYDVVRDYQKEVAIVKTSFEFKNAINRFMNETNEERMVREFLEELVIDKTSWNKTVRSMERIIEEKISNKDSKQNIKTV